jgi:hypothetical protein
MHSDTWRHARRCARSVWLVASLLGLSVPSALSAPISREEALALAFPGAVIEAERVFLTAEQQTEAAQGAGTAIATGLVARYVATQDGRRVGRAYIDTHVIRTKKESLLVSLDATGAVLRIDVTAFLEPGEYEAPSRWLRQYDGRVLTDDLAVERVIRPIAGATLTAHAVNEALRRVLAIDRVLERASGRPGP